MMPDILTLESPTVKDFSVLDGRVGALVANVGL